MTTPGAFAGSGYKEARVHFSLLALLFDIIANYDGEVRWKSDAAAARDGFARAAANLKAGGSIQVYNEAKKRKQDLADLVGGSRLPDPANAEPGEQVWADRVPLMQLLEQRLEANLKKWTASEAEFRTQAEALRHESELTAVIGRALTRPGMEDSEESEYQTFAHLLEQGAINVAAAVTRKDPAAARNAMADVSRSCSDCHERLSLGRGIRKDSPSSCPVDPSYFHRVFARHQIERLARERIDRARGHGSSCSGREDQRKCLATGPVQGL